MMAVNERSLKSLSSDELNARMAALEAELTATNHQAFPHMIMSLIMCVLVFLVLIAWTCLWEWSDVAWLAFAVAIGATVYALVRAEKIYDSSSGARAEYVLCKQELKRRS